MAVGDITLFQKKLDEGTGIEIEPSGLQEKINTLIDEKTLAVDSESKLFVNIDNDTLTINSEGKIASLAVSSIDEKTIIKNSEGKLSVPIDNDTITINSEGKLSGSSKIEIDEETIVKNSEGELSVPIDNDTITINSEGKLESKGKVEIDEKTIIENSEGKIETAVGGYIEAGSGSKQIVSTSDVMTRTSGAYVLFYKTVTLSETSTYNLSYYENGVLKNTFTDFTFTNSSEIYSANLPSGTTTHVTYYGNISKPYFYLTYDGMSASANITMDLKENGSGETIHYIKNKFIDIDNNTIVLDSEDKLSVPIDNDTISINSEGKLEASGKIEIDEKTIILDSEGKIKTCIGGYGKVTESEGTIIIKPTDMTFNKASDYKVTGTDSSGKTSNPDITKKYKLEIRDKVYKDITFVKQSGIGDTYVGTGDGVTINIVDTFGMKSITIETTEAIFPGTLVNITCKLCEYEESNEIHYVDNTYIEIDKSSIVLDNQGALSVPIDNDTIVINSEGKLEASGKVEIDEETILKDSEDKIYVPIDKKTLIINSDNKLETKVGGWIEKGSARDIEVSVNGSPTATSLYQVSWELTDEFKALADKPDSFNLFLDGDMTIVDKGMISFSETITLTKTSTYNLWSGSLVVGGNSFTCSVLDSGTGNQWLSLRNNNAEEIGWSELYVSTALGINVNTIHYINNKFIEIDNDTIVLDSEGKLSGASEVEIDEKTIVKNSEGKLSVPIDNDTIIINSEGKLKSTAITNMIGGNAIEVVDSSDSKIINVLYDEDTIILSSEGKLSVPIDERTIDVNSENKLYVNPYYLIDNDKVTLDSENRITVDDSDLIDNNTIILNSEGKFRTKIGGGIKLDYVSKVMANDSSMTCYDDNHLIATTLDWTALEDSPSSRQLWVEGSITLDDGVTYPITSKNYTFTASTTEVGTYYTQVALKVKLGINQGLTYYLNSDTSSKFVAGTVYVRADDVPEYVIDKIDAKYVDIDEQTLELTTSNQIAVNIDEKTLIYDSTNNYITTKIGGWEGTQVVSKTHIVCPENSSCTYSSPTTIYCDNSSMDFPKSTGTYTIVLKEDGTERFNTGNITFTETTNTYTITYSDYTVVIYKNTAATHKSAIMVPSSATAKYFSSSKTYTLYIYGTYPATETQYNSIDGRYVPIDDSTIKLNSSNQLYATNIITDKTTGTKYKIVVDNGIIGVEAV